MTRPGPKPVFEMCADWAGVPDMWYLSEPMDIDGNDLDAREFSEGATYRGPTPTHVPIGKEGRRLAFNFGAFDMPIVSRDVLQMIERIAPQDVQSFPVCVAGTDESFHIVNVIAALDCLDEDRSEFIRWEEKDNRPDRLGSIHVMSTLCVDPTRVGDHHIFRIEDWPFPLLVSSTLKGALQQLPNLGVVFKPAS